MDILRYLVSHPGAKDSAAGIRRWWLSECACCASDEELEMALDSLIKEGYIEERPITSQHRVFALREGSLQAAQALVQQLQRSNYDATTDN